MSSITPRGHYEVLTVKTGKDASGSSIDEVPLIVENVFSGNPTQNLQN